MTLLEALRERGLLLEGEDAMLQSPDAQALSPEAQLRYLDDNRRVGRFVTGLAAGVRLFFVAGGELALIGTMASGATPRAWWSIAMAIVLAASLAYWVPAFFRRLRELDRPLPPWSEIAPSIRS